MAIAKTLRTINFKKWIDDNRANFKPPVGNMQVWEDREFMVTVVGGPNQRTDYHVNKGEEFFQQLEGTMTLKIIENGAFADLPIAAGEIFLLPPNIPHSPQRPAGTLGVVIERKRLPQETDGFVWFCPKCQSKVYEEYLHVTSIVKDLPPLFDRVFNNPDNCTCKNCGTKISKSHHAQS